MKTNREIRLEAALRTIRENVPHFTYFFSRPEEFPPVGDDIWLHDLIDEALTE